MAGRRSFLTERAGLRRHHLHQGHGGCTVDREGSERHGMPQVLMSAMLLRRSGTVCRGVVAGTGIWAKGEGLYGGRRLCTHSLGSFHVSLPVCRLSCSAEAVWYDACNSKNFTAMLSIIFMYLLCPFLALYEPNNINHNYNLVWQLNKGGTGRRNHRWS